MVVSLELIDGEDSLKEAQLLSLPSILVNALWLIVALKSFLAKIPIARDARLHCHLACRATAVQKQYLWPSRGSVHTSSSAEGHRL